MPSTPDHLEPAPTTVAAPAPASAPAASAQLPVAIVTGATGGMGRQVVTDLLRDHQVVALGRSTRALADLATLGARTVRLDLADLATASSAVEGVPASYAQLAADLPRVDVLVHAAAVADARSVETGSAADWQHQFALNVFAPALLTRALLPALRTARGIVVFINSGAGSHPQPGNVIYAASKHALRGLADSLRKEEANAGVRVSTVSPGQTDTEMLRGLVAAAGGEYVPEHYIDPEQIAETVRFVIEASPRAQIADVAVRPRVEVAERR